MISLVEAKAHLGLTSSERDPYVAILIAIVAPYIDRYKRLSMIRGGPDEAAARFFGKILLSAFHKCAMDREYALLYGERKINVSSTPDS